MRKRRILFAITCLLLLTLCACKKEEKRPTSIQDFENGEYSLGVVDGFIFSDTVERIMPQAKVTHFASRDVAYRALASGAVDGVCDDEPIIRAILRSSQDVALLDGYLEPAEYAFAFPKDESGEKHCEEFSAYVEGIRESGELKALDEKWFQGDKDNKTSEDIESLPATNGTLTIVFEDSCIPFAYLSAGRPVGYDVDLAIGYCKAYGYGLKIKVVQFTDMLNGVASGMYDAGCGAITVTDKRKETLNFAKPDYTGGVSICVSVTKRGKSAPGFFSSFKRSFQHAFLDKGRYKSFFKGIGITLLITLLAVLFGTPFGFMLYIMSRRAPLAFRGLARLLAHALHAIPAVVLILALYYTYYKDMAIGGIIAAVIGFMLMFAEIVYRIICNCAGETVIERENMTAEDAYRLLAIDSDEFFKEIYKERGKALIRDYREGIISVLKMTAVAGYVAVLDMIGTFEQIRNESFEVGVPLMVTTVVYMILIGLITALVRKK